MFKRKIENELIEWNESLKVKKKHYRIIWHIL